MQNRYLTPTDFAAYRQQLDQQWDAAMAEADAKATRPPMELNVHCWECQTARATGTGMRLAHCESSLREQGWQSYPFGKLRRWRWRCPACKH